MNVALHIDFVSLADCLVLVALDASRNEGGNVGWQFVCDDLLRIWRNVLLNLLSEMLGYIALNMNQAKIAATFADAHYYFFVPKLPPIAVLLSANVRLINFDCACELQPVGLRHRLADAMR